MNDEILTAQNDLAFMRSLVDREGAPAQAGAGRVFLAAGLIYGLQCLAQWAGLAGYVPAPLVLNVWVGGLPTLLLLVVIAWMTVKNRGLPQSTVQRALNAVFSAMGMANVAVLALFAVQALKRHDWTIWEMYGCVVFAFQGAGWLAAFALRKRLWLLVVALGWLAVSVAMSVLLGTTTYVLVAALALLVLMALPGLAMVAAARRQA